MIDKYKNHTSKKIKIPPRASIVETKSYAVNKEDLKDKFANELIESATENSFVVPDIPESEKASSIQENKSNEPKSIPIIEEVKDTTKQIKEVEKPKTIKEVPNKIVKEEIKTISNKKSFVESIKNHEVPLEIVKWISALVSVIAIIRTFFYDFQYYQTVDNKFFAGLMSILLVSVSFVSPQVMIYAWKKRNILIGVVSVLFVVLSSYYSIFVTSEVIRLKRLSSNTTQTTNQETIIRARERVAEINVLEQQLFKDKDIELRERDSIQTALEQLIDEKKDGTWEFSSMRTRLNDSKKRIDDIDKQISLIQKERTDLKAIDGYYSAHIKTEDEKTKESSRDLIFAMFLDFVGPVFMSFSLFL